jgi:hypothetical protein
MTFTIQPMGDRPQDGAPIVVSAVELEKLAECGFVKITSTRVRYAMLAKLANINGGKSAFIEDPE